MIPFHPLADLFPLIEGAEFDALVADMRANGFRSGEEIVLLDGRILDGRNRYRAAIAAGIFAAGVDPLTSWHFVQFSDEDAGGLFTSAEIERGPLAYVISRNLNRRHLNESQRAFVASKLATMRQGARTDLRPAPEPAGGPDQPSANLPEVPQAEAARLLAVSERSLRSARAVQEHGTAELQAAVEQGRLAVSAAAHAARLAPEIQRAVAAEAALGHANAVRTVIKQAGRERREEALAHKLIALPEKRYGVIYADPEWRFEPRARDSGLDRAADNHYPTSATAAIAARDVPSIAAADCVLFLWATPPMLPDALAVMGAWGFAYKSHMIWHKLRPGAGRGTGYWFTGEHELLLVGTRGRLPAPATALCGSLLAAPVAAHSQKPAAFADLIARAFPHLPKIELNARAARPGWDAWGEIGFVAEAGGEDGREGDGFRAGEEGQGAAGLCAAGAQDLRRHGACGPAGTQGEEGRSGARGAAALVDDALELPGFLRRDRTNRAGFMDRPAASTSGSSAKAVFDVMGKN